MKITKLEKDVEGKIVNINIEMTDDESAFFIGFAFNTLLQRGVIAIQGDQVEFKPLNENQAYDAAIAS